MEMKKVLTAILFLALVASSLTFHGCGKDDKATATPAKFTVVGSGS